MKRVKGEEPPTAFHSFLMRAAPAASQSCRRGPHHDADDLRPDVLHIGGAVEPQGAGDVPQEAGDAEAHVGRVAEGCEHQRRDTDDYAGKQYGKILFHNK